MNMGSYSDSENAKSVKREAAEARQKEYDALSIPERIAKLDAKLGVGVGAMKEREKLAALLANPKGTLKPRVQPKVVVPQEPQAEEQEQS